MTQKKRQPFPAQARYNKKMPPVTFRLPVKEKKLLYRNAKKRKMSPGKVLRGYVRKDKKKNEHYEDMVKKHAKEVKRLSEQIEDITKKYADEVNEACERGKTEGTKEGYEEAKKEYEQHLKNLVKKHEEEVNEAHKRGRKEVFEEAEKECEKYGDIGKKYTEELKKELERRWIEGYEEAENKYGITVNCPKCGKTGYILPNTDVHEVIKSLPEKYRWVHVNCDSK